MPRHKYDFSIAYADTDAAGIVYHGRYIEIAERARMNWLRDKKIPVGDGFVIKNLNIDYRSPLKLGQDIRVETEVLRVEDVFLDTAQYFLGPNDKLCATLNSRVVYVGSDLRPKNIPDDLRRQMLGFVDKQR
ncbi:MAG: acyl-CoA thioesterase [Alphaproteobacteria bacterium]|nr:acyl-CoA thioesterase [Alphaproteobacteria bacterium]